ncbi:MAG TPA: Asp-tRNA(Asn)/Glu-tRNA(Gln) amidotransferase subunit GatB [Chroococcales cyanobacterium]
MKYEVVIGLEVHAELLTETKIFCGCKAKFGGEPNTHVCPICAGMPGVLPVLNEKVIEYALKAALAIHCHIPPQSKFDRKNYFYPDLPKGYQISQFDQPLADKGYLDLRLEPENKRIGITRLHVEEDAGKLVHVGAAGLSGADYSTVDLNRAGVPLIEIVSEPDMRSSEEAKIYMMELRNILYYLGVCDGKLEEGSLRCDANVSLRPFGQKELGTKTEVKNLNSFRGLQKALDYEISRQTALLDSGERIVQESRLWDEARGQTFSMRSKEEAHDYRYFPEPDLVPLLVTNDWIEELCSKLPELPEEKWHRYVDLLGLPPYDASLLVDNLELAQYFDQTLQYTDNPKGMVNWLTGEVTAFLNSTKLSIEELPTKPHQLAKLVEMIDQEIISRAIAKTVLAEMLKEGKDPQAIVDSLGLKPIGDEGALREIIQQVLAQNPGQVEEFRGGKTKVIGFLVGQVMRASKGLAKPEMVNRLLVEEMR